MPMGMTAKLVADDYNVSREEMDCFVQRSQERVVAGQQSGFSAREIVPVTLPDGTLFAQDESRRRPTSPD